MESPYVTREPGVCAGKPVIAGTRIRVSQVALEYVSLGWTADEILQAHPRLTYAQIQGAFSYYYDHTTEIHAELRASEAFVEECRRRHPGSVLDLTRGGA